MRGYGRGLGQISPSMAGMVPPDVSSSVYSGGKSREDFYTQGSVPLPAIGTQAVVVQRPIPYGRNSYLWKIAVDYVGGGFVEGQGGILYRVFRNAALNRSVKGFATLTASMGTVSNPIEIPPAQLYENELLSIVVVNVSVVVAGQQIVGALVGWDYPRSEEATSRWP